MAIARDASSFNNFGNVASGTQNLSHTCTGTDLILFVSASCGFIHGGSVTGITYNGTAMTKIDESVAGFSGFHVSLWYLIAPSTGTHNITATFSTTTSDTLKLAGVSYTGAKQSAQPDNHSANNGSADNGADYTHSLVSVADNCWMVMGSACSSTPVAKSGTNYVTGDLSSGGFGMFDRGPQTPAGTMNLQETMNDVGTSYLDSAAATFLPSGNALSSTLTETATFTSSIVNGANKLATETVTFTDSILKSLTDTMTETVSFVDSIISVKGLNSLLYETITFTDSVFKGLSKTLSETTTFTDSLISGINRFTTLVETIVFTDTISKAFNKTLTETVTFVSRWLTPTWWTKRTEPAATSYTDRTEPASTSYTDRTKPSTSWTDRTAPSATSYTDRTAPSSTVWKDRDRPSI